MIIDVVWVVGAYLMGSLSAAVLVARMMGQQDPRSYGSKNPGATNVLRHGGKKAAAFTLAGDVLKAVIPVLLAQLAGVSDGVLAMVGLAAFVGHVYPVFFGFKGGKGVATAAGVLLAATPLVGVLVLLTWVVTAVIGNISSLAALVAALLAPIYMVWLVDSTPLNFMALAFTLLIFWRHQSNIKNLLNGSEGRIKERGNKES